MDSTEIFAHLSAIESTLEALELTSPRASLELADGWIKAQVRVSYYANEVFKVETFSTQQADGIPGLLREAADWADSRPTPIGHAQQEFLSKLDDLRTLGEEAGIDTTALSAIFDEYRSNLLEAPRPSEWPGELVG